MNKLAECAEQFSAIEIGFWFDDHRFATALRDIGQRGLVTHALGQADHIVNGGFVSQVFDTATTAQCGAQSCVVDGDDGVELTRLIVFEMQFAQSRLPDFVEHGNAPSKRGCG